MVVTRPPNPPPSGGYPPAMPGGYPPGPASMLGYEALLAARRARRRRGLVRALIALALVVGALPYVWLGLGVHLWVGQVRRGPSDVAFDWGSKLAGAGIGDPEQGVADARAEECADSRPSAQQFYDRLQAATKENGASGWGLDVIPGKATVTKSGPVSATAEVPTWVEAKLWNVTVTDANGLVISHDGYVEENNHHWIIHLVRTRRYPVWRVCGITQDKTLFSH